jgi:hypothetical protein
MSSVIVPAGAYPLGWHHTLSADAEAGLEAFLPRDVYARAFSPARHVTLPAFEIQTEPMSVESLLEQVDSAVLDGIDTLDQLCDALDDVLSETGWRLPTEDELEAALGGGLFCWGDALPSGTPYQPEGFELHRQVSARGLVVPHDTYAVELTRSALKMGDGGSAVCGAYPWPVAWLTLSPSARVPEDLLDDLFVWLEDGTVHLVRVSLGES